MELQLSGAKLKFIYMKPRIDLTKEIEQGKLNVTGAFWDGVCTCSDESFEVIVTYSGVRPTKHEIKKRILEENIRGNNHVINF